MTEQCGAFFYFLSFPSEGYQGNSLLSYVIGAHYGEPNL